MNLRSSVVSAIYNKALVISVASLSRKTLGEITNLMSVDSTRLQVMRYVLFFDFHFLSFFFFCYLVMRRADFNIKENCVLDMFIYTLYLCLLSTGLDAVSARGVVFTVSNCCGAVLPIPTNGCLMLCRYNLLFYVHSY